MPLVFRLAALAFFLPIAAAAQTTLVSPNSAANGRFGWAVSGVPDVDGDGVGDLVVSASNEAPGGAKKGRVYILSGATGAALRTLVSPNDNGFGLGFGFAVVGLSDVNGDGFGDVAVGAPRESVGAVEFAGRVFVFSGADGALIRSHTHTAPFEPAGFGRSLAAVPDADGDGVDDLLVGAFGGDDNTGTFRRGLAHLYSGASGALLRAIGHPTNSATRTGFGETVAGVPDANGDGRGDLLIGAPADGANVSGRAFLIDGATGALLRTLANPADTEDGLFGNAVAGLPDVTGDGRGDLAVTGAQLDARVRVFNGATGALLYTVDSPVTGDFPGFGQATVLAGAPDADGDGRGEVLIGARLSPQGDPTTGRAYLVNGTTGAIRSTFTSSNATPFGVFGASVSAVPDLPGGYLIGAPLEDPGGATDAGHAYVLGTPGQTIVNVTTDESNAAASTAEGLCDVDRTEDGQQCTLRAAIELARAGRTTSFSFDLPAGDRTIAITSELPSIPGGTKVGTAPLTGGPLVRIDGGGAAITGLVAADEGVEIKGVSVTGFGVAGISLEGGGGHLVEGCYVGLDPDGTTAGGNGVGVFVAAPDVTIRRNVISGNSGGGDLGFGIGISGASASNATVFGNRIGLSADGSAVVRNDLGIVIDGAAGAVVDSNYVAGGGVGIQVARATEASPVPTGTRIVGNVIGLLANGQVAVAEPTGIGIWIQQAAGTQIGESAALTGVKPGNIVSGWENGIAVTGGDLGPAIGTRIEGNLVGLDLLGQEDRPNLFGIRVQGQYEGTVIGGAEPGQRNVIQSNVNANVAITHDGPRPTEATVVTGNWVGIDRAGDSDLSFATLGSATKVGVLADGAANVVVGPRNVISGNLVGVWADAPETLVIGNRIGTGSEGGGERANFVGVAATAARVEVGRAGTLPNQISGNDLDGPPGDGVVDGVGVWVVERGAIEYLITPAPPPLRSGLGGSDSDAVETPRLWGGAVVEDVSVSNNWIGLNAEGSAALLDPDEVSSTNGVWVSNGAVRTQVVGNAVAGQDVGIDLGPAGVVFSTAPAPADTRVADNRIGLSAVDDTPVPNRLFGLAVRGSTGAVIGEGAVAGRGPNRITATGEADFVPFSSPVVGAPGVFLLHPDDAAGQPTGTNTLTRNLIWGNGGLGITRNLADLGLTPNGEGDTDGVASFDTPFLYRASGGEASLFVSGTVAAPMTVEVFASESCDESGNGEGQRFLGSLQAEDGVFEGEVAGVPYPSWRVTTTGTNLNGTTSEFSPCVTPALTGDAATLAVGSGQTPSLDGPDIDVTVTANAAVGASPTARRADGTLFVALHRTVAEDGPEDGAFDGSATSDDGTTVTPDDIQRQRFWSVRSDGLDGITYEACLHIDELFSLPVPGQLLVVTRPGRGAAWTPHATTLRGVGAERAICADGLTTFGELAIGADGTVNPVPDEPGPDALPTTFAVAAYPNPSRGRTTISVDLPTAGAVTADVLDALGRRVARLWDGPLAAGTHALRLDAALAPGVYIVRVRSADGVAAQQLTVVR